jgi:hypothetical protein
MPLYKTARADFEYLETLADLDDQVDIDSQREELMREPTKAKAADLYEQCISLWFGEHRGEFADLARVCRIATRYGEQA